MKNPKTQITLTEEQLEILNKISKQTGVSKAAIIRLALEEWLKKNDKREEVLT